MTVQYNVPTGGALTTNFGKPEVAITKQMIDRQYVVPPKHVPIQLTGFRGYLFIGCSCGSILKTSMVTYDEIWRNHNDG